MNEKFVLSTDSTCDLYSSFVKEHDIKFVSLTYTIEDSSGNFYEGTDKFTEYSQYKDFYDKLRSGCVSRTSMLNYDSHVRHFTALAREGAEDVVHFTISSGLSPTVTVAEKAAADVKKSFPRFNLFAVDSLSASVGQGALVKEALRMRDEGKTARETAEYIKRNIYRYCFAGSVNDLNYLKRGGRISVVSAIAGNILGIKPVLSLTRDGKIRMEEKVRGMKRVSASIIKRMQFFPPSKENSMICVVHTDAPAEAERLAFLIEREFCLKTDISIMGPVIGSHIGPGGVGVMWKSDKDRV